MKTGSELRLRGAPQLVGFCARDPSPDTGLGSVERAIAIEWTHRRVELVHEPFASCILSQTGPDDHSFSLEPGDKQPVSVFTGPPSCPHISIFSKAF